MDLGTALKTKRRRKDPWKKNITKKSSVKQPQKIKSSGLWQTGGFLSPSLD
jgi:hypothetical protein